MIPILFTVNVGNILAGGWVGGSKAIGLRFMWCMQPSFDTPFYGYTSSVNATTKQVCI